MRRIFYERTGRRAALVTGAGVVYEPGSGRVIGYVDSGALFDDAGRWVGADVENALLDAAGHALAVRATHALLAGVARDDAPLPELAAAPLTPLLERPPAPPVPSGRWSERSLVELLSPAPSS